MFFFFALEYLPILVVGPFKKTFLPISGLIKKTRYLGRDGNRSWFGIFEKVVMGVIRFGGRPGLNEIVLLIIIIYVVLFRFD